MPKKAAKKPAKKPAKKAAKPEPHVPTQDEIDAQIARLEELHDKVVPRSAFGDDNLMAIEAMIEVLREDLSDDDIYQREEDGDWEEHVAMNARDARAWLDGQFEEPDLASGWPLQK